VSVPTVAFATLGCRLNQVDSQVLAARLEARGYRTVPFESAADVVVVNTCAVTARAEASDRQTIRRAARAHPGARVVVTGCWAQTNPGGVAAVRGVDAVVGNADKERMPEVVGAVLAATRGAPRVVVGEIEAAPLTTPPAPRAASRARAFVKVQEGCAHRCAFCIVPLARGVSRSLPPDAVLEHARRLVALGQREIVLTGVDLGHYGADLTPRTTLAALVRELVGLRGLRWLRLSSVLPAYFTPELIEVIAGSPVVAPQLHIPLQSGSDRILRRMRRPYTVAMYRALVERLGAAVPNLGLGADVIVGFPGETEDDFAATRALVEALPFSYLHVFGYSDRAGTEAATLAARVDAGTIGRRSAALRVLGEAKAAAFRQAMVGTTQDVLVLETRDRATGALVGLTGNYVEVLFEGADSLMRSVTRIVITEASGSTTRGRKRRKGGEAPLRVF
jgi:threonylcarbamoyladenosine tRNA methylthiotransferase MtaB